jgi:hypothetical protein
MKIGKCIKGTALGISYFFCNPSENAIGKLIIGSEITENEIHTDRIETV